MSHAQIALFTNKRSRESVKGFVRQAGSFESSVREIEISRVNEPGEMITSDDEDGRKAPKWCQVRVLSNKRELRRLHTNTNKKPLYSETSEDDATKENDEEWQSRNENRGSVQCDSRADGLRVDGDDDD